MGAATILQNARPGTHPDCREGVAARDGGEAALSGGESDNEKGRSAYVSATGASELEDFVQREVARIVLPHVRLTLRTAAEDDLTPCDAHTDRDQRDFRTSCANKHSVPP